MHEQAPLDAFRKSSLLGSRSTDGCIGQTDLKSLLSLLGLRGMAKAFLLATKNEDKLTDVPVHMRGYVQGECWSICHDTQDIMKQYPDMQDVSAWLNCRHAGSNFSSCAENRDSSGGAFQQVFRYSLVCRHLALVHTLQFPSRRRPTDLNLPGARFLT